MRSGAVFSLLVLLAIVLLGGGCGQEDISHPSDTPTNILVAYYQSEDNFESGIIEINGERIDREWGSEFTTDRPFLHVRVSAAEGSGNPGPTRYVSMKAVYTDTHLYLLVQWSDATSDQLKDVFIYRGSNLAEPIVTCQDVGGETVCDTTYWGPQDSLQVADWWERVGEDDKLAIAFQAVPTFDGEISFADAGCQVLCHTGGAPPFGMSDRGRMDIWLWLAGRTNPIKNLFDLTDDPDNAVHGIPGYLDDCYSNHQSGLLPDEGWPGYLTNDPDGTGVPKYVYRRSDDDMAQVDEGEICENWYGAECRPNNGVPYAYLWREYPNDYVRSFSPVDTLNDAIQPDPRPWVPGDVVPGYTLTYPSESRADIRGKGNHDEDAGVWTLEIARKLDTGNETQDLAFDPDSGTEYYFTIAIFDASVRHHWGSEPQILVFGEKGETQD